VGVGEEETCYVPARGDPRCAAAGGTPERRPPLLASTPLLPLAPSLLRCPFLHSAGGHPPSRRRPLPSLAQQTHDLVGALTWLPSASGALSRPVEEEREGRTGASQPPSHRTDCLPDEDQD
jgi:hypothetical protein